jgi:hypothetical protein
MTRRPRSIASVAIKVGALASGALGVWGVSLLIRDPGGPEDPTAWIFALLGLDIALAALAYALSARRYGVPILCLSVLAFAAAAALAVLFAG